MKITPSDLRTEAQRLIEAGSMPKVETLLAAIADARKKYGSQIIAARNEAGANALKS